MASSSNSKNPHHIRSISLPNRSHPVTLRIEDELNKLKTWQACRSSASTAERISNGLSRLENVYNCFVDLLNLPHTQQALSHQEHEKWTDLLLDGSVRVLDICNITRDLMSQILEHVRDLMSSLRRRKGDLSVENSIAKYISFRKKMKKEAKKMTASLKQIHTEICRSVLLDLDHDMSTVIWVLKEVITMTISILQSTIWFLSVPVSKPKPTRWSLVSKLMRNGKVADDDQQDNLNELESVDAALFNLCRLGSGEVKIFQIVQNRLEALDACIEGIENGLECVFRGLIRTRASLLNITFHQGT